MIYYNYSNKSQTIVTNLSVYRIKLEYKTQIKLLLEIDYNSFEETELEKIIKDNYTFFNKITSCSTYNEEKKEERCVYIPVINENNQKEWLKILTENNIYNFNFVKHILKIKKNDNTILKTIDIGFSKSVELNLSEGNYIFEFEIYNQYDELIKSNEIQVEIFYNNYKLDNNKSEEIIIEFPEEDGGFDIKLSADSERLYSFTVDDIIVKNNKIIDFTFYNENTNDPIQRGKIGSVFNFLSEKQIEEIENNPELENYIKGNFLFDIQELLSPIPSKDDIGIIRLPTLRSKLNDNLSYYYDLKCNIDDTKNISFNKTENILITDKFNKTPLFYKFIVNKKFTNINIFNQYNKNVENYILEKISDNITIIYFQPLRNTQYFYKLDDLDTIYNVSYKQNKFPFTMVLNKDFYNETSPVFMSDIVLKSEEAELEFEIIFDDFTTKNIILKSTLQECEFLENERVKINRKIISLKCISNKPFEIYNMIGNVKNNRTDLIFLKKNTSDFIYLAYEYNTINLEEIPLEEISKMKVGKKYIYNSTMIEQNNGPLELKDIELEDIVFTDIEEYKIEEGIAVGDSYSIISENNDKEFFHKNIKESSMEVNYED